MKLGKQPFEMYAFFINGNVTLHMCVMEQQFSLTDWVIFTRQTDIMLFGCVFSSYCVEDIYLLNDIPVAQIYLVKTVNLQQPVIHQTPYCYTCQLKDDVDKSKEMQLVWFPSLSVEIWLNLSSSRSFVLLSCWTSGLKSKTSSMNIKVL